MADLFKKGDKVIPKRRRDLPCEIVRKIEGSTFYECKLLKGPPPLSRTFQESDLEAADAATN